MTLTNLSSYLESTSFYEWIKKVDECNYHFRIFQPKYF